MRSLIALFSVALLSACAHLLTDSARHPPYSVECARRAVASINGLTVESSYDAIYFKGSGFSGWFHHGSELTFTQHSVDIEYFGHSKAKAMKAAAEISSRVAQSCAAQQGAAAQ